MPIPFGKRVKCGNYVIEKHTRALGKKELKKLRDAQGIPPEVQKELSRGALPYITVSTLAGSWKIEWVVGMSMFNAIDEIPVMHDDKGNYEVLTGFENDTNMLFNFWACATATVGDETFQSDVIKAMQEYLKRQSEKNKEPLPADEAEKVLDEEEKKESHAAMLQGVKDYIDKEEGENGDR